MSAVSRPVEIREGLVYAVHDGVALLADLYSPAGPGPHPVVVAVPGGGWRMSKRTGLRHWAAYLAARGIAVFAIEYRTSAAGPSFPRAVQDVMAALQYVALEHAALGVDATRLAVVAASAGAHLAALATFAAAEPPFRGGYPDDPGAAVRPPVRALVLAYGVYDLHSHWDETRAAVTSAADDVTLRFMGVTPEAAPERYRAASPIRCIGGAPRGLDVLLTWGTADRIVSPTQTVRFGGALRDAGICVEEHPVAEAGHHWFSEQSPDDPASLTAGIAAHVVRFLLQRVGPVRAAPAGRAGDARR